MESVTPMLSPALRAYAQAADHARPEAAGGGQAGASGFGELLEKTIAEAIDAGRQSEAATASSLVGQADLQAVVEAVNAAEITLQTVVAVRDRMISAYQEIMRMPI